MVYAAGYALICIGIFALFLFFSQISFSPSNHRLKELRQFIVRKNNSYAFARKSDIQQNRKTLVDEYDEMLEWMGRPFSLSAPNVVFVQLVVTLIILSLLIYTLVHSSLYAGFVKDSIVNLVLVWLFVFFGSIAVLLIPYFLLRSFAERSKRRFYRQFQYMLNFFQIYLRSGFTPTEIVQEIIVYVQNPLRNHLVQLLASIQVLGERAAFDQFAKKLKFDFAERFKNAVIDAILIGSDAAEICKDLSNEMLTDKTEKTILRIRKKPFVILIPKACFVVAFLLILVVPILYKLFSFTNL